MQKEFVVPITNLEVGESVYLPLPCFMKSAPMAMAAYDTHGTVIRTHMLKENMSDFAEVFFPAIDGAQMLPRVAMARKADGSIVHCRCHDNDAPTAHPVCDCEYTSIAK